MISVKDCGFVFLFRFFLFRFSFGCKMEQEPPHLVKARKDLQAEAHNNYNLLLERWCGDFFCVMTVEAR